MGERIKRLVDLLKGGKDFSMHVDPRTEMADISDDSIEGGCVRDLYFAEVLEGGVGKLTVSVPDEKIREVWVSDA